MLFASYLPELYRPVLECFARDSRELVRLTVTRDERLVGIGAPPGLRYQPAMTGPVALHVTANGKAWLATLAESDVLRIERPRGFGPADPHAVGRVSVVGPVLRAAPARAAGW